MTMKLLVSPISVEEARIALEGGADIIDVKNPKEGSLGANFPDVIQSVKRAITKNKKIHQQNQRNNPDRKNNPVRLTRPQRLPPGQRHRPDNNLQRLRRNTLPRTNGQTNLTMGKPTRP